MPAGNKDTRSRRCMGCLSLRVKGENWHVIVASHDAGKYSISPINATASDFSTKIRVTLAIADPSSKHGS